MTRFDSTRRFHTLGALAALGCALAACGSDAKTQPDAPTTPDAAPDPVIDAAPDQPAVVLVERVFSPEGRRYAISVLPDVPTAAVDRTAALVLTSADPELFGGKLYVRDRDANTMTRYKIAADRKLVQDGQLSFASTGLGASRYSSAYVAADRAYLMDSTDWRLIGWNPTTMALTGEIISLANMKKDPALTGSFSAAVKVGDRLVSAINWEDFGNLVLFPGTGALVIELATPSQPKFLEDARVGGSFRVTADGNDAYLTGTVGGDVRKFGKAFGDGALPASGLLKLPGGSDAFDPAFLVDVEAITGTKSVWAIHRITATTLLAQIFDPALDLPATAADYNASTDFEYVTIDTVAKTFAPVANLPKGGRGNSGNHVVDGTLYIQASNATGSTAYAVSAAGVAEAFPVPAGDVWFLARVR